jgi:hypothetical protein
MRDVMNVSLRATELRQHSNDEDFRFGAELERLFSIHIKRDQQKMG